MKKLVTQNRSRTRWIRYFTYLDNLRESGAVNMWGSSVNLREAFPEIGEKQAKEITLAWMQTFKSDISPEQRVDEMLEETNNG